ncbi:hypothetical protein Acr_18g0006440 [Actinidia rufa]|uniref:Uncharacterized protein n=1 Tax=Actinidia rufa TaxID=165716 RepID=A0A7J0G6P9_9ERIC|nr:hypothetical protein Acr_18g0006440 [Actinidia rufa]
MEIQRTWLSEFKDRPIITGQEFERNFPLKYYQRMLAPMNVLGWNGLQNLFLWMYTPICSTEDKGERDEETSHHAMEVEGDLEVLLPKETYVDPIQNLQLQWQDEETMHGEEHAHEGVNMEEGFQMHEQVPMHGGHSLHEGTSTQGGLPAWFLEYFGRLSESMVQIKQRQDEIIQNQARQEQYINRLRDIVEKQGQYIDRLGDSYENLYEQHTAFNQQ